MHQECVVQYLVCMCIDASSFGLPLTLFCCCCHRRCCCCVLAVHAQGMVAGENISCTACAGTLLLEFGLLSKLTGNNRWARSFQWLMQEPPPPAWSCVGR